MGGLIIFTYDCCLRDALREVPRILQDGLALGVRGSLLDHVPRYRMHILQFLPTYRIRTGKHPPCAFMVQISLTQFGHVCDGS